MNIPSFTNNFTEPTYPFVENQADTTNTEPESNEASRNPVLKTPVIFDIHKFLNEKGTKPDLKKLHELFDLLKSGTTDLSLLEKLRNLADNYRSEYLEYIATTVPAFGEAINTYSAATEMHTEFTEEQIENLLTTFKEHVELPYLHGEINSMIRNYIFTLETLKKSVTLQNQLSEKEAHLQTLENKLFDKDIVAEAYSALSETSVALIYSDLLLALEHFSKINLNGIIDKSEQGAKDSGAVRIIDLYRLIEARIAAALDTPELAKKLVYGNKIVLGNMSKALSNHILAILESNHIESLPKGAHAEEIKDLASRFFRDWNSEEFQHKIIAINGIPTKLGRSLNTNFNKTPRHEYGHTSSQHATVYLDEKNGKRATITNISTTQPIYIFTPGENEPEILQPLLNKEATAAQKEMRNKQIIILGGVDKFNQPTSLAYLVVKTSMSKRLVYIPPTYIEKLKALKPNEFELFAQTIGNLI